MSNITLGQLIEGNEGRDAVHVAIVACKAAQRLFPGMDVGVRDGVASSKFEPYVGIVDPYLNQPILPDSGCWVCLYPNTVTSLKHEWTHPAFEEPMVTGSVDESKAWLETFAERCDVTYNELMKYARDWLEYGTYHTQHGHTTAQSAMDGSEVEFWHHYQVVTGKRVPTEDQSSFFSCSC